MSRSSSNTSSLTRRSCPDQCLPQGSTAFSCAEGRLKQVTDATYSTVRPFTLELAPDAVIRKEGKVLRVADFLEETGPSWLRIAFRQGRTISPVLLLESFSRDGIRLEETEDRHALRGRGPSLRYVFPVESLISLTSIPLNYST